MSDGSTVSRRDVLRNIALAATLGGIPLEAAQHVHHAATEEKKITGVYKPKAFNEHEYATLRQLAALILPSDDSGKGALDGGAPEFIDLLSSQSSEMLDIYTGGIAWIDREMEDRYGASFVQAKPEQQTAFLDKIAFKKSAEAEPALGPGIQFFAWIRKMV
ncbi:MAG TPA: gluconate 2-dehydrogenase subunit 3 family protein, partial [Bryobacteraceae bacterium]|nr:gluconate 2-dehydrogenase subunit 3 family protein [Bryobacteraceae bacterium]